MYLRRCHKLCSKFIDNNPDVIITESDKGRLSIISLASTLAQIRTSFIAAQIKDGVYSATSSRTIPAPEEEYSERLQKITAAKTLAYDAIRGVLNPHFQEDRQKGLHVPGFGELKPKTFQIAKLVVVMKTHKGNDFPIRPIITAPDAMSRNLEDFLKRRIERLYEGAEMPEDFRTGSPHDAARHTRLRLRLFRHIVPDSTTVQKELEDIIIPSEHRLFSIDFVNMYTNISADYAIHIIDTKFERYIEPTTSVPRETFKAALEKVLHLNQQFSAGMQIFTQQRGLPMGGKLSEVVTSEGISAAINEGLDYGLEISYIAKYVDDILVIMRDNTILYKRTTYRSIELLKKLIEDNIVGMPVTFEEESTNDQGTPYLMYLNMNIMRSIGPKKDGTQIVSTKWATKPYASNRITNA